MKEVYFIAGSKRRIKNFPVEARVDAGHQLWLVQLGEEPDDWRPMQSIGTGVKEIRIHKPHEHRVIYLARFQEGIYVLHAFEKKTKQTAQHDIEIARAAYAEIQRKRQQKK
jgi:phage-related protein